MVQKLFAMVQGFGWLVVVWYLSVLDGNITGLRAAVDGNITGLRAALDGNITGLRTGITGLEDRMTRLEGEIQKLGGDIRGLDVAFQTHTGRAFQAIKLLDSCSVPLAAGAASFVLTLLDSDANVVKIVTAAHALAVLLTERPDVFYPAVPKYKDDFTQAASRLQLPKNSSFFRHNEWQLDPNCDLAILVMLKTVARTLFQDYVFCKPAPAESHPRSGEEAYFFASNQQLEFSTGPVAGTAGSNSECPNAVLVYAPIRKAFSGSPVAINGQVAGVAVREVNEQHYWIRSCGCCPEQGGDLASKCNGDPSADRLYALFVPIKSLDALDNKYNSSRFTFWFTLAMFSAKGANHAEQEFQALACKMLIQRWTYEIGHYGTSLRKMLHASCRRCMTRGASVLPASLQCEEGPLEDNV